MEGFPGGECGEGIVKIEGDNTAPRRGERRGEGGEARGKARSVVANLALRVLASPCQSLTRLSPSVGLFPGAFAIVAPTLGALEP